MAWGDIDRGISSEGILSLGGFCPRGILSGGDFVWGGFVQGDFVRGILSCHCYGNSFIEIVENLGKPWAV